MATCAVPEAVIGATGVAGDVCAGGSPGTTVAAEQAPTPSKTADAADAASACHTFMTDLLVRLRAMPPDGNPWNAS
jgi:hypothetical protein